MEFKKLLRQEIINSKKMIFQTNMAFISIVVSLLSLGLVIYLDHMFGLSPIVFIPLFILSIAISCLVSNVLNYMNEDILIDTHTLNSSPMTIKSLKYLLRIKTRRNKQQVYLKIYFKKLNKELQQEALNKLSKQELRSFDDFFEIHNTPIFKDMILQKYPKESHTKVFMKLTKSNFFKLLKDVPKTQIDDFLEDRVKKTIV